MQLELNQEQARLVLQALDKLNISKYAYPEEYKVANVLMAKLHKELRTMEQELEADIKIKELTKDYGNW